MEAATGKNNCYYQPPTPCFCFQHTCLVNGTRNEGNIFIRGRPVCDDYWGDGNPMADHGTRNANVLCRSLGFLSGQATVRSK